MNRLLKRMAGVDNNRRSALGVPCSSNGGEAGNCSAQPEKRQKRETDKTENGRRKEKIHGTPNTLDLSLSSNIKSILVHTLVTSKNTGQT